MTHKLNEKDVESNIPSALSKHVGYPCCNCQEDSMALQGPRGIWIRFSARLGMSNLGVTWKSEGKRWLINGRNKRSKFQGERLKTDSVPEQLPYLAILVTQENMTKYHPAIHQSIISQSKYHHRCCWLVHSFPYASPQILSPHHCGLLDI